ncbi:unnamed protein product [Clavelina lepadiformis]|uniref:Uncharacterized protein n=1 Tax=Clavelina lepadiformis TaxID=159417 RepID=A0ABP0G865_CLALP
MKRRLTVRLPGAKSAFAVNFSCSVHSATNEVEMEFVGNRAVFVHCICRREDTSECGDEELLALQKKQLLQQPPTRNCQVRDHCKKNCSVGRCHKCEKSLSVCGKCTPSIQRVCKGCK